MKYILFYAIATVVSYLLGSISFGVVISKVFYKTDLRDSGSGNAGATNALRTLGKKAAIFVLLGDVLKGVAAVFVGKAFGRISPEMRYCVLFTAFAVLLGHLFPIFFNFRGGKGVATFLGVVITIEPVGAAILFGVFIVAVIASRMVSLGSVIAAVCCPFVTYFYFNLKGDSMIAGYVLLTAVAALLVIFMHRKNISRIIKKEESKIF